MTLFKGSLLLFFFTFLLTDIAKAFEDELPPLTSTKRMGNEREESEAKKRRFENSSLFESSSELMSYEAFCMTRESKLTRLCALEHPLVSPNERADFFRHAYRNIDALPDKIAPKTSSVEPNVYGMQASLGQSQLLHARALADFSMPSQAITRAGRVVADLTLPQSWRAEAQEIIDEFTPIT